MGKMDWNNNGCPLCNNTGRITVIVLDPKNNVGRDTLRPCPMGCKPQLEGNGTSGNMSLEGNELKAPRDYKRSPKNKRLNWKSHYMGRDE